MDFKPLLINDFQDIKPYFRYHSIDLCVYSPSAITVWNNYVSSPYFHIEDNTLFIANIFKRDESQSHMIYPLSSEHEITPEFLYESAVKYKFRRFWFIPETYVLNNPDLEKYFKVSEQTYYKDYVYDSMDLSTLRGKKYSKKRNLINQFKSSYLDQNRVITEKICNSNIEECVDFINVWFENKDFDKDDDSFRTEKMAAESAVRNAKNLEFDTLIVRIDGKIHGFTVGSRINDKMWGLHFEKASSDIKGLYQYLDRESARQICDRYDYVNKESDMGVEGIARSKRSYFPVKRYSSYKLELK